jgi:hypothetical protein
MEKWLQCRLYLGIIALGVAAVVFMVLVIAAGFNLKFVKMI